MSSLVDFIAATPTPLILHLVPLAPLIHHIRHLADILTWSAPWEEPLLLLALWWSFCLFADLTLRFFFPFAILFVLALGHWSHPAPSAPSAPATTETTIHVLVDDLAAIHALIPSDRSLPSPSVTLLRIAAFLYLPYLVLTYFVPLRICIALAGTLCLIHHAHWARNARAALERSAHLRWAYYHVYAFVSGTSLPPPRAPSPPPEYASRPTSGVTEYTSASSNIGDDSALHPSPPLRFLFTVYENQRWWVGLDWTAALLPGERPSWCSASQQPLPPPSTFSLPSPTTSFVPVGKHGRAKRMARWTWEEPEWRVVVKKEGLDGGPSESPERDRKTPSDQHVADPSIIPANEDDIVTDPEGWVYGDNKWEGESSKGGMGKYTRYRRWTRIAILTETVELVGPGEFGVMRDSGAFSVASAVSGNTSSMVTAGVVSPTSSNFSDWESTGSAAEHQKDQKDQKNRQLPGVCSGSG
ncbi:Peroxin/Dysferlin domain-containing protein [Chiua virens]|nr:Peroxin/Dysferlin domain-containing protein [Chiua virens]